jgi:hypothetical protein
LVATATTPEIIKWENDKEIPNREFSWESAASLKIKEQLSKLTMSFKFLKKNITPWGI